MGVIFLVRIITGHTNNHKNMSKHPWKLYYEKLRYHTLIELLEKFRLHINSFSFVAWIIRFNLPKLAADTLESSR